MMQLHPSLACAKSAIENKLEDLLAQGPFLQEEMAISSILDSARYSLLAPGKRWRPLLVVASADLFSVPLDTALFPACALEMIHTYSLIHDDLPCMDDDELRRGKPSLHKAFPEWQALLTGDYLLTYAFDVMARTPVDDHKKVALIQLLAQEAGLRGMLGGQMIDLLSTDKPISLSVLETMHLRKTASLLIAALESGAILGGCDRSVRQVLRTIGQELGLAYQLIDDLLDITEETSQLGKPAFSDLKNKKTTAISLLGIPGTVKRICQAQETLLRSFAKLPSSPLLLENISKFIFEKVNKFL